MMSIWSPSAHSATRDRVRSGCAYCHSVDAFVWDVVGSVAGVMGAVAAFVFGLVPLLRERRDRMEIPTMPGKAENKAAAWDGDMPVVVGEIPQQPVAFQPRAGLLAGLEDEAPEARVVVVRALTGMRGVGKTHLAAAYARARLAERWRLVAWINAEERAGVLAGLSEVAAALGLQAGDGEAAGRVVRRWLETGGDRCLLVFDNAADPALLRTFIPAAGAARVIITSNEQSMGDLGADVPVEVFTPEEALAFLAERTGSADVDARLVAEELGYLPLALAQAAAVIAGQRLGYGTYLDRLRARPAGEMLKPEKAGHYPRGVAAAVLLSVEGVRADDDTGAAGAVMELLAVLSPAGVRRTMIHAAGRRGALGGEEQAGGRAGDVVDRALARLAGASLLTFSVDGSTVTAHRLVMRVIRDQLVARDALVAVCSTAAGLLDALAESLDRAWHEDRAAVEDLVEQIMALYGVAAACPDSDLARRLIGLRSWAVVFLTYLGHSTAQLIGIAEPLLADDERVLGTDHPDTLTTRNNLALAYREAGRTAEAIRLYQQTLADRERVLGTEHPETLRSRGGLASAYRDAGRLAEAIALHEQTLASRERVLGTEHPDTLATRVSLGSAYREARRTAEAIALYEQVLAERERVLGSDHPDTMATRGRLGGAYRDAGRLVEAIALHKQALADRVRVLGTEHPDTLRGRSSLANDYREAGRPTEASTLHEQVLADQVRVLGNDHPDALKTRDNLASDYHAAHTARATGPDQ
jgi:tetratricopeptide (TPR) repeat protein